MKIIDTKIHGILDYAVGVLLMMLPWLCDFDQTGAETWVPVLLGVITIVYSLFTDYELGIRRVLPLPTHLFLDILNGLLLAASPWLFGFSEYVYLPHLVLGITEIVVVILSKRVPHRRAPIKNSM